MSFKSSIDEFITISEKNVSNTTKAGLEDVFGRIIKAWPVGDPSSWNMDPVDIERIVASGYVGGRSRGDWRSTLRTPSKRKTAPPPTKPRGADLPMAEMKDRVARFAKSKGNSTMYFSNNQPYAWRLEYRGWSNQMPSGIVRRSVSRFQSAINSAASKYGK